MSDLQLETTNKAEQQTTLVAMPHDLGPDRLKDFVGAFILEVVPDHSLATGAGPSSHSFGGVFGRGAGRSAGIHGQGHFGVIGDGAGKDDSAGVLGRHTNFGPGVRGQGTPGVVGVCNVRPTGRDPVPARDFAGVLGASESEAGVFGTGKYGGQFEGTSAQLSLVPGRTTGKPTSGHHALGELYMDAAASLFICVGGGTPGAWVKVVTA